MSACHVGDLDSILGNGVRFFFSPIIFFFSFGMRKGGGGWGIVQVIRKVKLKTKLYIFFKFSKSNPVFGFSQPLLCIGFCFYYNCNAITIHKKVSNQHPSYEPATEKQSTYMMNILLDCHVSHGHASTFKIDENCPLFVRSHQLAWFQLQLGMA